MTGYCDTPRASPYCCNSRYYPEGMALGHPYQYSQTEKDFMIHIVERLYPYGGGTYAWSRGMLQAVGRPLLERHVYGMRCTHADINIMFITLNAGYSITHFVFSALHHIHGIDQFINVGEGSAVQIDDKIAMCIYLRDVLNQDVKNVKLCNGLIL